MPEPAAVDIRIIQGSDWVVPFRLVINDGTILNTTGYTARCQVRATAADATKLLDATTANGMMQVGYDPPPRANLTAYDVGQQITPAAGLNGYVYQATVAGTSGAAPPTYLTTLNATFADGSVTWRVQSTDALVSNLRLALTAAQSAALTAWSRAQYDIELVDTFGHVMRIAEGFCVLSAEVTR